MPHNSSSIFSFIFNRFGNLLTSFMFKNAVKNSVQMCFFRYLCLNENKKLEISQPNYKMQIKEMLKLIIIPWQFLFNFIISELFYHLHIFTEQHNMNCASNTKYIRLIRPQASFQHFRTCETICLYNLQSIFNEKKKNGNYFPYQPNV